MSDFASGLLMGRHRRFALPGAWVRSLCVAGVVALLLVGALLASRRAAGALTDELPGRQLVGAAVIVGAVVLGGRVVWRWNSPSRARRNVLAERAFGGTGSVALLLMAAGCSWGATAVDWAVWLPLVAADWGELWWFLRAGRGKVAVRMVSTTMEPGEATFQVDQRGYADTIMALGGADAGLIPPLTPPFEGGGCELQRVVRMREEDGTELVYGTLRAEFTTGQRQATLYVAFCPPLERLPAIELEAVDETEAELKAAQVYCHGTRIEVRLAEPAEEDCSVLVEMVARPQAEPCA